MIGDNDRAVDDWIRRKVRPTSTRPAPTTNQPADLKQGDRHQSPPGAKKPSAEQWIRAAWAAQKRIRTDEIAQAMNDSIGGNQP